MGLLIIDSLGANFFGKLVITLSTNLLYAKKHGPNKQQQMQFFNNVATFSDALIVIPKTLNFAHGQKNFFLSQSVEFKSRMCLSFHSWPVLLCAYQVVKN